MPVAALLCVFLPLLSPGEPAAPHWLDANDGVVALDGLEVLHDVDGTLTINDVAQRPFAIASGTETGVGLQRSVLWARLRIAGARRHLDDDTWALRALFPRPHELDVWTLDDRGAVVAHARTGLTLPHELRPVADDDALMVPLPFVVGTHIVRAVVEPARMSFDIGTDRAFAAHRHREGLWGGLYYGIFVGLVCFNLLFGVATRDPAHLLYCVFASCMVVHMGVRDGWVPNDMPRGLFLGAGMTLTSLASTAFARRFLGVEASSSPRLARAFSVGIGIAIVATIPPLLGVAAMRASMVVTLLNIIIMVVAAVDASRHGSRPAQLFLLAWGALIGSVVLAILNAMKIIDEPWTSTIGVRVGAASEMILLALALAARVGVLRAEKESAELALKDTVLAQHDAVTRSMIEAQEAERLRFARDLHDGIGHSLLLIKQTATREAPTLTEPLQQVLDDARGIARSLIPPRLDTAGLAEAVRALADEHSAATHADVDVLIDDDTADAAHELGALTVHAFRIVQEALSNATRHGGADHVKVTATAVDGRLRLHIVDNGRGIADDVVSGVGLTGMAQRARVLKGTLLVGRRGDGRSGTAVVLDIPLQQETA